MTFTTDSNARLSPRVASRLGNALMLWAVPALVSGVFITFSVNHSAAIGLIGLAILSAGAMVVRLVAMWHVPEGGQAWWWCNGAVAAGSLIVSIIAIASLLISPQLGMLTMLVALWAAVATVGDLVLSLRNRAKQLVRDLRTLVIASMALALIELLVPLTSVYAVGILGAYGILTGVYLVIAGLSFRFDAAKTIDNGKQNS